MVSSGSQCQNFGVSRGVMQANGVVVAHGNNLTIPDHHAANWHLTQ
jgi:hypothetical protein